MKASTAATMSTKKPARVNPFATRYVHPGAIPWLVPTTDQGPQPADARFFARLVDRFENECQRRAAIVGPHGTGKSTLLEHLIPRLGKVVHRTEPTAFSNDTRAESAPRPLIGQEEGQASAGYYHIVWLSLRRDRQPFTTWWRTNRYWSKRSLLVIDGFEQLHAPLRWLLRRVNQFSQRGLLVTSHRPSALTTLCAPRGDVATLQATIRHAFRTASATGEHACIDEQAYCDAKMLQALLEQEGGNIREVLMRLYDRFEARSG
jgi:hypothetical protein